MTLASLLEPVALDDFFRDHWEQHPLVVPHGDPGRFRALFTSHDLDRLISAGIVDQRDGRIVKSGATDSSRPMFYGDGRANIAVVHAAYAEGHTVVVNNVQQRRAEVAALCRDVERAFGQTVGANAYLTPAGAQGLAPHFDNHDVLVLQCEGSKEWRVYEPLVELPLADQHFDVRPEQIGALVAEFRLEAGDVLYMPRGFVHVAAATHERSLHLTLGISSYRLYDALAKALWRAATADVAFRRSTPPRIERQQEWRATMRTSLEELAARFVEQVDFDATMTDVHSDLISRLHALPDATIDSIDRLDAIELKTRVRKREGAICCVVEEGDVAVIQFPGNAMSAPAGAAEALHFIAAADAFAVRDLPPSLTDEAKIVLTRRLAAMGLLVVI